MTKERASLKMIFSVLFITTLSTLVGCKAAQENQEPAKSDYNVERLLEQMTLEEKVTLMSGANFWQTASIERLNVPSLTMSDGPVGVRSNAGEAATLFPSGVAIGATWNPDLIEDMGRAVGGEAKAMGLQLLLGPNINIQRLPVNGRHFETYSEDPYLTGELGVAMVKGIQSNGIGTSPKHFVANNQEFERHRSSSNVSKRALREIYLAGFEQVVKEADPWTVMAAYNRVNGTHMSEHDNLLNDVLKKEWGFDGIVISDWGATKSVLAAQNGLDLEMPGPAKQFGEKLTEAVKSGEVTEAAIDEAAKRMLNLIGRSGGFHSSPEKPSRPTADVQNTVALHVAHEAITLMKNDANLLPLTVDDLKSIAVIGPNADAAIVQGGGSAQVIPTFFETPLEAISRKLPKSVDIEYAQGVDNELRPPALDHRLVSTDESGSIQGLTLKIYSGISSKEEPMLTETTTSFDSISIGSQVKAVGGKFATLEGFLRPRRSGLHKFSLLRNADAMVYLDGKPLTTAVGPNPVGLYAALGGKPAALGQAFLTENVPVSFRVEYRPDPYPFRILSIGMQQPSGTIDEAVKAAKDTDIAILFVGVSTSSESEGADREDIALPGDQDDLVRAVLQANPKTIVVLNNGGPLAMPWVDTVDTVVEAWLPGQKGPQAIADILFGDVNPSGRLPTSFPKQIEDTPAYPYYPGGLEAEYGEGVFVGYRHYDKNEIEPLFPFGHGLSYTDFEYDSIEVSSSSKSATDIIIEVNIRNIGDRQGQEVVQLYVEDVESSVSRPKRELKGFAKLDIPAGKEKVAKFSLNKRSFAFFDPVSGEWTAEPGFYRIHVGSSSRDIRVTHEFELQE